MIGRIHYISKIENAISDPRMQPGTFNEFCTWFHNQKEYQLDIETNVTDWWETRVLISLQFGSCTPERVQWFLQWSRLTVIQQGILRTLLEIPSKRKLIHNATYEYVVLRFHDIILENVVDTMLNEKILMGGLDNIGYGLDDISWKYLRIVMDKGEQMNFGDDIITESKLLYAITDVAYLDSILRQQIATLAQENLLNVAGLEKETVLALGDITYEGMMVDKVKWRQNIALAQPLVNSSLSILNSWLFKQPFRKLAIEKGYISDIDRVEINFNAPAQKKMLLQHVFPDIAGASMPIVKKYIRDKGQALPIEQLNLLVGLLTKDKTTGQMDTTTLEDYMLKHHREWLISQGFLIPAGQVTINWNSTTHQVLPLALLVEPKMQGMSKEEVARTSHPFLKDYQAWSWANMLVTDLGEQWLEKYVGPDGKVHTNFNQVLVTGRVSSSNPNMQNITVDERVGTRYRNAFICEEGWSFVDSDYKNQELVVIAHISKDPVWLECIRRGEDLHSVCAHLVHGERKWKQAALPACEYFQWGVDVDGKMNMLKQKCKCPQHKILRDGIKSINFGLAYGMTEIKLALQLGITRYEALQLINVYFSTFPMIRDTMEFLGNFGITNGYITTLYPFLRKRYFPYWREWRNYIEGHIQGIKYVPVLGEIERQSKNQPIQGASADITKCAMVLIRNYIRDHNLWKQVKLQAQVHDQVTTKVIDSFRDEWKLIMHNLMLEAARVVIPSGILGADTNITAQWTK